MLSADGESPGSKAKPVASGSIIARAQRSLMKNRRMRYRFFNDYSAGWPFWGDDGLCAEDDPALPPELKREVKDWADQFERLFDWQHGWPDKATAEAHRHEGERLYAEVQRALPNDTITFRYWETGYRNAPRP